MMPEFPRPERLETIGAEPRDVHITADETERRRLAGRFALRAIDRLEAEFRVVRQADAISVTGRVTASLLQTCVVTDAAMAAEIAETVALRFVAEDADATEIELGDDAIDTIELDGGIDSGEIDLGEIAAETVALAIDPYPRAPGAEDVLREAGIKQAGETGAFAALAALKTKLGG